MGLFNRKKPNAADDDASESKKEKGGWRRPANTAFKQQRLKAWQPILTPKTVLPTLFIIGIIFAPVGGLLIWASSKINEMTFDYTDCDQLSPATSIDDASFTTMPSNKYNYRLSAENEKLPKPSAPRYAFINNTGTSDVDVSEELQCVVEFDIPADLQPSVFFYYKLTNFYQNHRRYVKSLNTDQLKGKFVSAKDLDNGDCKPLATIDGKPIFPCGLIANSLFNDTFGSPILVNPGNSDEPERPYEMTSKGIVWPGEAKKYATSPIGPDGYDSPSDIVPPPNWARRFPDGYTEDNIPDLRNDEHFQNWMRTAGLPTFTKLYSRNDQDTMLKGTYRVVIGMNFPVRPYKGTKSFVISTVSAIGGKNPFLGWAYVAAAGVFVLLAVLGLARHLIKPRRLGDMSLLSWNR
ncbi:transcription regulator [Coprinopsis cinerea okayama7|uniref:Transcription regulator n=1 Tax=Coprinopsis cinerea (strain Okayama-7 / 130 / ATCC MYA-4618 / FGSC 9003) TaxID=240176 RepID=A8NG60_COPC7|nr:transcription regulator [Coprinopsis cinerea okayama7\|eukprot:XP_001833485.1 transcription regulator [Coprinopsis cinerea okayama7\